MNHLDEPAPAFRAPPQACDAHFHVFGPAERYPHGGVNENLRYAPPLAPLSDYLALARHLLIERFVFVQPSAYGRDNACMLDAMREVGIARCRGIVDVDADAPDALLAEMHALGVRGVRINVSPVKPPEPGFSETMRPRIERLDARCAELGWHLDVLAPGWLTEELLPIFAKMRCAFSLAHMGMFRADAGPTQRGFRKLLDLLRHGDGRAFVKLTGTYRMATPPTFADAAAMARALIEAAPDRLIWGSDYPHLSFADKVGSVQLFNLLADWADAPMRQRILVDNPAVLFGFS
jgi:predicted TIM-barrel fold metal-dependent hydrolase